MALYKLTLQEEPEYKFNEPAYLNELTEYVTSTYEQHYSKSNFQATEFILDCGHGSGFCIGNILKYAQRYQRKGEPDEWRKDLLKICHYAIIALYNHDKNINEESKNGN